MSLFRLNAGLKLSFENNSDRKNLFLSASFCCDAGFSLLELDQKFEIDETIGYGNLYLDFVFCLHFSVHAKLNKAAVAVRSHSGKGRAYCYMNGLGPKSCLFGHVTGLLFCLYLKLFVPSIVISVDFWSRVLCIVLDFELALKCY